MTAREEILKSINYRLTSLNKALDNYNNYDLSRYIIDDTRSRVDELMTLKSYIEEHVGEDK